MKRYYLVNPSDWPHPIPDANGKFEDRPFTSLDDPRIKLGEAHYMDLTTLGGPTLFIVVVPSVKSEVPSSWKQLPHMLGGGKLAAAHLMAIGKLTHQVNKSDLSPQAGDTTYAFFRRLVDGLKDNPDPSLHHPFDPEQW